MPDEEVPKATAERRKRCSPEPPPSEETPAIAKRVESTNCRCAESREVLEAAIGRVERKNARHRLSCREHGLFGASMPLIP